MKGVKSNSIRAINKTRRTSVKPDLHLLEGVVDGVAENDEPGAGEDEEGIDLVGVTQTADEESAMILHLESRTIIVKWDKSLSGLDKRH